MKKTITLLFAVFLALGISAQNFGVGLDYMVLSGTMVKDANGNAVTVDDDGEIVETNGSSAVLNVSYTHPLSEKSNMVGSVGLGMGFGLVPMKLSMSYGMTPKMAVNVGMGMYMITDAGNGYAPTGYIDGGNHVDYDPANPSATGSKNEFGGSIGVSYVINNISLGLGYEMIKGGDHSSLNAITIGLSYAFYGNSVDEENE